MLQSNKGLAIMFEYLLTLSFSRGSLHSLTFGIRISGVQITCKCFDVTNVSPYT